MMRLLLAAALFPVFSLRSANLPAEQPPAPAALQPGQWEMVTETASVEAPGVPEPLLQQMRAQLAEERETRSQCLTPDQARDPARAIMGSATPPGCEFSEMSWTGGSYRISATCRPPGSPPLQLALEGTYVARQIQGRISVHMEIPDPTGSGPAVPLDIHGRMTGRRTGDCAGQ